jgi:hypothetical protein
MESREQKKKSKSQPDDRKCVGEREKSVFAVSAFTIPKNRRQCHRHRNGFMAQASKSVIYH